MLCDLHRHFGGSISPTTVSKVSGVPLSEVERKMLYADGEESGYEKFFHKFRILDGVKWDYQKIDYTIQDVVWGLRQERIDYAEIKFSINKYLPFVKSGAKDMVLWFAHRFDEHASRWGIEIDLILSLKHNQDKTSQKEVAELVLNDMVAHCIAGIDIVGNENFFDVNFYKPLFDMWHDAGKVCMAHVGEINQADHVHQAVKILQVDRICHGIAAADDEEIAAISRDRHMSFDICITSNIRTGVATLENHPVKKMLENGFLISVGTDDPAIFGTTLKEEYALLKKIADLSDEDVDMIQSAAANLCAREILRRKNK